MEVQGGEERKPTEARFSVQGTSLKSPGLGQGDSPMEMHSWHVSLCTCVSTGDENWLHCRSEQRHHGTCCRCHPIGMKKAWPLPTRQEGAVRRKNAVFIISI